MVGIFLHLILNYSHGIIAKSLFGKQLVTLLNSKTSQIMGCFLIK